MNTFIELLKQRRIWSSVAGFVSLLLMLFGADYQIEMSTLTDLLNNFGIATANLLAVILPILSYIFPKKVK